MSNTFGQLFRVTTFGESHGGGVGVVIDGCPPNIELSEARIQRELDRRRPGQSKIATQRKEEDRCEILSGIFGGKTLGTPIAILVRNKGDSVGGVIECVVRGIPPGLGEPVFDKLDADLAKAMLSIPATKGFEIGSGFAATRMRGSQHNDPFEIRGGRIRAATNNSGGAQGGISNGEEIYFRVAFKPTATIAHEQKTVTSSRKQTQLAARGRHDPCVLPRAVPIVEAMAALVLCDHALRQRAIMIADRGMSSAEQ